MDIRGKVTDLKREGQRTLLIVLDDGTVSISMADITIIRVNNNTKTMSLHMNSGDIIKMDTGYSRWLLPIQRSCKDASQHYRRGVNVAAIR